MGGGASRECKYEYSVHSSHSALFSRPAHPSHSYAFSHLSHGGRWRENGWREDGRREDRWREEGCTPDLENQVRGPLFKTCAAITTELGRTGVLGQSWGGGLPEGAKHFFEINFIRSPRSLPHSARYSHSPRHGLPEMQNICPARSAYKLKPCGPDLKNQISDPCSKRVLPSQQNWAVLQFLVNHGGGLPECA